MGVNSVHERTGSTEIWCIFRAGSPEKKFCKCQNPSYHSLKDFGCQVELDMEESFTLADTSFCSMKSTGKVKFNISVP